MAFWKSLLDSEVEKVCFSKPLLLANHVKKRRLRYTAVKKEHTRPIISVVAKPLMGPVPKSSRMMPVMIEVRLESKMAEKALE